MKALKKEIGVAIALGSTIAILSFFWNAPQGDYFEGRWALPSEYDHIRPEQSAAETQKPVQIMDADIQGELRNGTFEVVIPFVEMLTREKGGLITTEHMTFKDGLWTGEVISQLPPANASAFVMEIRQEIDRNGRVVIIDIDIREFPSSLNIIDDEQYSTISTFLWEKLEEIETPGPITQIMSAMPVLVTGLVWIAQGVIVGMPLCFVSLGVVMMVKRTIIPLWRKELSKSV